MDKKIWGFYIRLSDHFWDDENSPKWNISPRNPYCENNDIDFEVWDDVVDTLAKEKYNMLLVDVGDGVKYESHPEISAPNAVSKEFLKKKIDEAKAKGIEAVPKLNFSTCHDTWMKEYRRMVSSKPYRKVVVDLIDELCELFGPSVFHLGMDEENDRLQTQYEISVIRHEKLLWEDMNIMFDACRKNNVRPWVWSDYFWDHPDLFKKHMPLDVLQSNWYYGLIADYPKDNVKYKYINTYVELDKLGYDQVPTCSTWSTSANPLHTLIFTKQELSDERLKGFVTASWVKTNKSDHLYLLNEAYKLYEARQKVYPETL